MCSTHPAPKINFRGIINYSEVGLVPSGIPQCFSQNVVQKFRVCVLARQYHGLRTRPTNKKVHTTSCVQTSNIRFSDILSTSEDLRSRGQASGRGLQQVTAGGVSLGQDRHGDQHYNSETPPPSPPPRAGGQTPLKKSYDRPKIVLIELIPPQDR